jgi:hypothetical protein
VLKTREWLIFALLAAVGLSYAVGESQAGLFDLFSTKSKTSATNRAQSPDPGYEVETASPPPWMPREYDGVSQVGPVYQQADGSYAPIDFGECDSSPCFWPCSQGVFGCRTWCKGPLPGSFNCGDNDHFIECTRFHRRKCGETWYPRLAPYCEPHWGWTQPCWRRMTDNYNCPSQQASAPKPPPKKPHAPSSPPAMPPTEPEPPPASVEDLPESPAALPRTPPAAARLLSPTSYKSPMSRTTVVIRGAGIARTDAGAAPPVTVVRQPAPPQIRAAVAPPQVRSDSSEEGPLDTLERRLDDELLEGLTAFPDNGLDDN